MIMNMQGGSIEDKPFIGLLVVGIGGTGETTSTTVNARKWPPSISDSYIVEDDDIRYWTTDKSIDTRALTPAVVKNINIIGTPKDGRYTIDGLAFSNSQYANIHIVFDITQEGRTITIISQTSYYTNSSATSTGYVPIVITDMNYIPA